MYMEKKIKKRKKHRHTMLWDEPCNNCGYQEGFCLKCDVCLCRKDSNSKIEVA